jgi:hypothetical protein
MRRLSGDEMGPTMRMTSRDGPNRRAQERERAATRTAVEAKRAAQLSARRSPTRRRSWRFGTRGKPVAGRCGSTRLSAPPSRPVSLGSPTHAQRASKSTLSTCAPSTGIRALRFPASSRRCRAGGARLTRRLRGWKCWRRNGLGGSRRQTEYRKRKYNCGFSAQTCNVVKDTKNGEETHD